MEQHPKGTLKRYFLSSIASGRDLDSICGIRKEPSVQKSEDEKRPFR